jgi:oligopeptide/dipeptide ABC transporter ATP-binding protein
MSVQSDNLLLSIRGLQTHFVHHDRIVRAVDGLDLDIHRGEILGLVGESGSGKTMTTLSILRLVRPPGRIVAGQVLFEGRDLLQLPAGEMREVRGGKIGMIFQNPMTALNPVYTIGWQIREALVLHRRASGAQRAARTLEVLEHVGIGGAARRAETYPHQLSGGQRQRAMIAMALSCHPALLIADECTTALDVTIQAQILDLLLETRSRLGTSILIVTHDLAVAAQMCDRIAVMYGGHVVEVARTKDLFANPQHPYTHGLLNSIPRPRRAISRLPSIPGQPPEFVGQHLGCRFAERCSKATSRCSEQGPAFALREEGHLVRCWHPVN